MSVAARKTRRSFVPLKAGHRYGSLVLVKRIYEHQFAMGNSPVVAIE
jgi:hypothetical protein